MIWTKIRVLLDQQRVSLEHYWNKNMYNWSIEKSFNSRLKWCSSSGTDEQCMQS